MKTPSRAFRLRLTALAAGLGASVLVCIALATVVQRDAGDKLRQLAHVELEAAALARQFRAAIDHLHGALLRIGSGAAEDSAAVIQQRRQELSAWLRARQAGDVSESERRIVQRIDGGQRLISPNWTPWRRAPMASAAPSTATRS